MKPTAIPAFTETHAGRLRDFLAAPERPKGTMSFGRLGGFLFAVSCSPEFIKPSEWMPLVFHNEDPGYETPEEAREVMEAVLSLYNHINREVQDGRPALPPGCEVQADPVANFGPDAPLGAWAGGFTAGHDWLVKLWESYTPQELDQPLGSMLLVLSFFASRQLAETYLKEFDSKERTVEEMAAEMLTLLPEAIEGYADVGSSISRALEEERNRNREPAVSHKVGRNEPCPCGSGKKHKKCCGAGLH